MITLNDKDFKMIYNRVLIEDCTENDQIKNSSVIIPSNCRGGLDTFVMCKVLAVGRDVEDLSIGDIVCVSPYHFEQLAYSFNNIINMSNKLLVIPDELIMFKVDSNSECKEVV